MPASQRWVAGKNNPDNAWEYFAECSGVGNCNREDWYMRNVSVASQGKAVSEISVCAF